MCCCIALKSEQQPLVDCVFRMTRQQLLSLPLCIKGQLNLKCVIPNVNRPSFNWQEFILFTSDFLNLFIVPVEDVALGKAKQIMLALALNHLSNRTCWPELQLSL